MKKHDIFCLVVFFIASISIYCYMGIAFSSQANTFDISVETSQEIWDVINELESSWYKIEPITSVNAPPLTQSKKERLQKLVGSHEIFQPLVEGLIQARIDANRGKFFEYKEKISEKLMPTWPHAGKERHVKEQARREKIGWIGRIKEDILYVMNSLYSYFFAAKKKRR